MNKLLNHLRIRSERLYITLKTFFKWLLLSGITGICCGVIGSLFHLCMEFATQSSAQGIHLWYTSCRSQVL